MPPLSGPLYLGLDLSTQQLKAVVINQKLQIVCDAKVEFDVDLPKYGVRKGVHVNEEGQEVYAPVAMWLDALDLVLERLKVNGLQFRYVRGIGGAGQQHGSIYWSQAAERLMETLDPSKTLVEQLVPGAFSHPWSPNWQDASTQRECDRFNECLGGEEDLAKVTGSKAHHRFTGPQILRFRGKYPEIYKITSRISLVSSFLASLVLGSIAPIDISDVCGMNLWDIGKCQWSEPLLRLAGGQEGVSDLRRKLGDVREDGGGSMGSISSWFVSRYGFPEDCQVAPFTGDNPSTILALPLRPLDAIVSLGTSTTFLMSTPKYIPHPSYHFFNHPTTPGLYMFMLCYKNGGLARERIRDSINESQGITEEGSWEAFNKAVTASLQFGMRRSSDPGKLGLYFPQPEIVPNVRAGVWRFYFDTCTGSLREAREGYGSWKIPQDDARAIVESQFLSLRLRSQNLIQAPSFDLPPQLRRVYLVGGGSLNEAIASTAGDVLGGSEGVYRLDVTRNACALGAAYKASWSIERGEGEGFEEYVGARWREEDAIEKVGEGYMGDRWGLWKKYGEALKAFEEAERRALEGGGAVPSLTIYVYKLAAELELGTAFQLLGSPPTRRDRSRKQLGWMNRPANQHHLTVKVEKAVQIAWNPTSDQDLKAQAFDFLNQLRSDPSGGQVCLTLFTTFPKREEIVRHFALDMVGNSIQNSQLNAQSLGYVKNSLMEYIRRIYGGFGEGEVDSVNIQNKLTQTVTYLFAALYAAGWEDFFGDFLNLVAVTGNCRGNVAGAALYLRVLSSVHDEIADVLVPRSQAQQKRNMQLKDLVRGRDVGKVVSSWQEILSQCRENDAVVEMCLKVIGRWASWIDISLLVNDVLLSLLFQLVGRTGIGGVTDKVRDAAINTLTEIAGKKMKPADKIELILFLNLGSVIAQLVASPPLHELRSTSSYDTDLAEAVGKLVNNVVTDAVKALDTESIDEETRQRADELLQVFLPYLLRFFSDEYDEICSTAIPALTDILTFFRREVKAKGPLPQSYATMLSPILNAVIAKMKYDETSSWGSEDEKTDEAEFQELRKRLQQLQQAVAAVDELLYMDVVSNIVANTFSGFNQQNPHMDWRDLDLALHEMFLFGELAMKAGGLFSKGQPTGPAAATLVGMMHKMVDSGIASFSHPAIQLQYMEICVRYASFFESQPQHIPQVLENFVRFVHHNHIRVKIRSWYLFHRFVKHLRAQLENVAQTVIETVSDLLVIKAELPKERADDEDMSSDESDHSEESIFNSQLYLFEAIGCISSTSSIPIEKQLLYGRLVMNPLFADMENHINPAKGGDERAQLQIHHDIMALGTLARGFSDWTPGGASANQTLPPPEAVSEEFKRGAEATLVALESLRSSQNVRLAARSAFSRFVGVLGEGILPQLPRWIDGLLSQNSTKDEMATFLRMLDQVVYGFKAEIYNILNSLLTPLLQRVFAGLAEETTGTDDEIQLAELRREYLNFLLVILNNDLGPVLVSEVNQNSFMPLITTIEHFAQDTSDLQTSKLAFSVLHKMSTTWGGPDITSLSTGQQTSANTKTNANDTTAPAPTPPALPGFDRYMIERFSPVGWRMLFNASLNPKDDAQARTVVWEVAALQKTIYVKTGAEFIEHLREVYFPSVVIPQGPAEEYLQALQTLDSKAFRQFFQVGSIL